MIHGPGLKERLFIVHVVSILIYPRNDYTNIQVITLLSDYKTFSQKLTLLPDPNRSTQYITIVKGKYAFCP